MSDAPSPFNAFIDRSLKEPLFAVLVAVALTMIASFVPLFSFLAISYVIVLFITQGAAVMHLVLLGSIIAIMPARQFSLSPVLYLVPYAVLMFSAYMYTTHRSRHFFAESCFFIISLVMVVLHLIGQPLIDGQLSNYQQANTQVLEMFTKTAPPNTPNELLQQMPVIMFQFHNTFYLIQLIIGGLLGILVTQQRNKIKDTSPYKTSMFVVGMTILGYAQLSMRTGNNWINPHWFLLPMVAMGVLQINRWIYSSMVVEGVLTSGGRIARVINIFMCFFLPYYLYLMAILGIVSLVIDMDSFFKKPKKRG